MARAPHRTDPAGDAAGVLRRLGFAVLMLILPSAALLFRRGAVVLLPIGVVLLVAAAALDGKGRPLRDSLERLGGSAGVMALVFAIGWSALSLTWTLAPAGPAERFLAGLGGLALGLLGYFALPDRMRSANLYLLPIGVAAAAILTLWLSLAGWAGAIETDEDGRSLERGLSLLVLFAWPSIAWLRSRDRDAEAACLVILIAVATLAAPQRFASVAFALGALAYVATTLAPRAGAGLIGGFAAALILVAPAIPFGLLAAVGERAAEPGSWLIAIRDWRAVIAADPGRLLTGHGFGTLIRDRLAGAVAPDAPDVPLLRIWYEAGLVGALAAAAALFWAALGAARSYAPLLPGIMATFVAAFSMACLGIGSTQAWWPAALVVVGLVYVAAERGQFRTRRPRAGAIGLASP